MPTTDLDMLLPHTQVQMPGLQRAQFGADEFIPARLLTTRLTRSYNVQELLGLYQQRGATFNKVHISAFWTTLGKHARRNPKQLRFLQGQLVYNATLFGRARAQTLQMLPELGEREVVNVAHGAPRRQGRQGRQGRN